MTEKKRPVASGPLEEAEKQPVRGASLNPSIHNLDSERNAPGCERNRNMQPQGTTDTLRLAEAIELTAATCTRLAELLRLEHALRERRGGAE